MANEQDERLQNFINNINKSLLLQVFLSNINGKSNKNGIIDSKNIVDIFIANINANINVIASKTDVNTEKFYDEQNELIKILYASFLINHKFPKQKIMEFINEINNSKEIIEKSSDYILIKEQGANNFLLYNFHKDIVV